MFEHISTAPADPILGLADIYQADPRPNKINLGIGVYTNEDGITPILNCVKKAEQYLLDTEITKNYLSIEGPSAFATATQSLLFGKDSPIIKAQRAFTAQTPGGTGALRVAADFIAQQTNTKRIWISNPTWPNHKNIFQAAGLEVCEYEYYNADDHALNFDGILQSLQQATVGDIVILHTCCHNPTGFDLNHEQWQQLVDLSLARGWLPLFDFAYQGFAHSLDEDAYGLRLFAEKHDELLIASSYSKNFGLYNERVGACTLVAANNNIAERAFSQIKAAIRSIYSSPPSHGGAVVAKVLNTPELYALWLDEVTEMRGRIQQMRHQFVKTLHDIGIQQDFSFILKQNGMFSFSGLSNEQVLRLRNEFGVYAVTSGRINIAGLTTSNIQPLCQAIKSVL